MRFTVGATKVATKASVVIKKEKRTPKFPKVLKLAPLGKM